MALALAAAASADGAWCGIAGIPEAGVLAAAALGLDAGRILLVPDPGPSWPQVVASLLDEQGRALGLGASAYLAKPIDGSHLRVTLANLRGAPAPGA